MIPVSCIQVSAFERVELATPVNSSNCSHAVRLFPSLSSPTKRNTPSRSQYERGERISRIYILLIEGVTAQASSEARVSRTSQSICLKLTRYSSFPSEVRRTKRLATVVAEVIVRIPRKDLTAWRKDIN